MSVVVAYTEDGRLYLAPDTVPWAYEENGRVYVREFSPVVTVSDGRVLLRLPADGPLTYEAWGERPQSSLAPLAASAELAASGPETSLELEDTEGSIE